LAADAPQRMLTQYLMTTFGLAERQVRDGLETLLTHPEQGIFRWPYRRVRTRSAPQPRTRRGIWSRHRPVHAHPL
jgi:hypothetical protein